jgi:ABC-type transport system substrate-binding protein
VYAPDQRERPRSSPVRARIGHSRLGGGEHWPPHVVFRGWWHHTNWNGQPYLPLALRYPTRVHSGVKIFTRGLLLNTHLPPFNNLKARQAVNYAIDRSQVIQLLGGGSPGQATVTCQILPAGFPGHQPYCPYTAGPKDGFWHGPDLAKARQLAQDSRTTNAPVTVWDYGSSYTVSNKRLDAYLAQLFRQLRYRATVRDVTSAPPPRTVRKMQVSFLGFGADFPTASNFFLPFMSCHSLDPAEYCNPLAGRLARQAQAAQLTDPAAARQLWTQVDRIVTDQAPWVPIFNETPTVFVSARAGNYQESPYYGPLLDQIWVR